MTEHQNDPLLAEAIARRDESRAQILRAKAQRAGGDSIDRLAKAFGSLADRAEAEARKSAEAVGSIEGPEPDLSGTAPTLSDSAGNFAPNPEVANVGGIGVEASNTKAGTDEQAQKPEEVDRSGATEGVGPAGEIKTGDTITIPDNWQSLSWQERRSLASKLTDEPIRNGDDADRAIEAELAKRSQ